MRVGVSSGRWSVPSERTHEASHSLQHNGTSLMMRVVRTVREESTHYWAGYTGHDCVQLGPQAVFIVGSLNREHRARYARQLIDNRPRAHFWVEPEPGPPAEQDVSPVAMKALKLCAK